jgi:hypothetical protein
MKPSKPILSFPDRKISESFMEFAEPLVVPLGTEATAAETEAALKIAFTVWNAVVYADAVGETQVLDDVRKATAQEPDLAALIGGMIERKRSLFGDDHRLVGDYKFIERDGRKMFRVEARAPTRQS